MPHFVIEHSASLNGEIDSSLLQALAKRASELELAAAADLKLRAISCNCYWIGDAASDFCHLTISMHAGRSPEQKKLLSESMLAVLVQHLPGLKSVSVEVRDMDRASYAKRR